MHGTRDEYIAYRESKSEEAFEDAKLLLENGRWNACVNRLYYSAFYLISAILFKENIKVETHNGAKTKFFLHFVKSGQVTKKHGKLYSSLFDWRNESDYTDFIDFDEGTVKPLFNDVANFNTALQQILNS